MDTTSHVEQPMPTPSDGPPIVDLVQADLADLGWSDTEPLAGDLHERMRVGVERYGMPLRAHNGRDALIDAYQEALDLPVYLRQRIEEILTTGAPGTRGASLRELVDVYHDALKFALRVRRLVDQAATVEPESGAAP